MSESLNSLEERLSRLMTAHITVTQEVLGRLDPVAAAASESSISLLMLHELSLSRLVTERCITTLNQRSEETKQIRETQGEIIARLGAIEQEQKAFEYRQRAYGRNQLIGVTVVFLLLVLLVIVIAGQFSILQRLVAAFGRMSVW